MPLYDQEKMAKLVSELRKSVARLRSIGQLSYTEFIKDPDKIGSSKYHFIVGIEFIDAAKKMPLDSFLKYEIDGFTGVPSR